MKRKVIAVTIAMLLVGVVGVGSNKSFVLEANAAQSTTVGVNKNEKIINLQQGQYHFYFADENYMYGAKIDGYITKPIPQDGEAIVKVSLKDGKVENTKLTAFKGFPYQVTTNAKGFVQETNVITNETKELVNEDDLLVNSKGEGSFIDIKNSDQFLHLTYITSAGKRDALIDKYNKTSYIYDSGHPSNSVEQIYKSPSSDKMYMVLSEIYDANGKDLWVNNVYEIKLQNGQIVKGNKVEYKDSNLKNAYDVEIVNENGKDKILQTYFISDLEGKVMLYDIESKKSKELSNEVSVGLIEDKFITERTISTDKVGDVYRLKDGNLIKVFSDIKIESGNVSSQKTFVNTTGSKYISVTTAESNDFNELGKTVIAVRDAE